MKKIICYRFAMMLYCIVALCFTYPLIAQTTKTTLPRVEVFGFLNMSGDSSFDNPAETATKNLFLSLRMMHTFTVTENDIFLRTMDDASLSRYCQSKDVDRILYGNLKTLPNGGMRYTLSVFDNTQGKTTIQESRDGTSVLDVFSITDELTQAVLSSLTGRHIAFGVLQFVNTGVAGEYEVLIDDLTIKGSPKTVDHIVTGTHTIVVNRVDGSAPEMVVSFPIEVKEGNPINVSFALSARTSNDTVASPAVPRKDELLTAVVEPQKKEQENNSSKLHGVTVAALYSVPVHMNHHRVGSDEHSAPDEETPSFSGEIEILKPCNDFVYLAVGFISLNSNASTVSSSVSKEWTVKGVFVGAGGGLYYPFTDKLRANCGFKLGYSKFDYTDTHTYTDYNYSSGGYTTISYEEDPPSVVGISPVFDVGVSYAVIKHVSCHAGLLVGCPPNWDFRYATFEVLNFGIGYSF